MCGKIKRCLLKPPFLRAAAGHWLFSVGPFSVCSLFNSHTWTTHPNPKSAVTASCGLYNSLRQLPIASSVIQAACALPCDVLASWALPTPSPHALFRRLTSPPLVVLEQLQLPSAWVCSTVKAFCNPGSGHLSAPEVPACIAEHHHCSCSWLHTHTSSGEAMEKLKSQQSR